MLLEAAIVALGNLLAILIYGGFAPADLQVPLSYDGDALQHQMWIKSIIEEGWLFHNARLGAPFAAVHLDYPIPDLGTLLAIKAMGFVSSDPIVVFNLLFLSSFFLVPLSAHFVARLLGLPGPISAVVATAFNLLPFHFIRIGHLFYTLYFTIPVFVFLSLRLLSGAHARQAGTLATRLLIVAAAAAFGVYNAAFGFALLVFVGLYVWRTDTKARFEAFLLAGAIVASLAICLLPYAVHRITHGPNAEATKRLASDSELYGTRLTLLMLPPPEHRVRAFARVGQQFHERGHLINENRASWLGTAGAAGLVLSILGVLGLIFRRPTTTTLLDASRANLYMFLIGTMGGLGALFNHVVWTQLRAYNRISPFIAFLSLVLLAMAVVCRWKSLSINSPRAWVVGISLSLLVAADLVAEPGVLKRMSDAYRARYERHAEFARHLVDALPANAMVFQLPHQRFPEAPPVNRVGSYDGVYPYLHTSGLRFSFGAMRATPEANWQDEIALKPPQALAAALADYGFSAILIDRKGYADGGGAIKEALRSAGLPLLRESEDYIALRLNSASEPRRPRLQPFEWQGTSGFHGIERSQSSVGGWCEASCTLRFRRVPMADAVSKDASKLVEFSLEGYGPRNVRLTVDGQRTKVLDSGQAKSTVQLTIPAQRLSVTLMLEADTPAAKPGGGDNRLLAFRIFDVRYPGSS